VSRCRNRLRVGQRRVRQRAYRSACASTRKVQGSCNYTLVTPGGEVERKVVP